MKNTTKSSSKKAVKRMMRLGDGIRNELMRVGAGTGSTFNGSRYDVSATTFNRQQLEWAYQSSWVCALMIDLLASDMTREGIDLQTDDPDVASKMTRQFQRLAIWEGLSEAIRWARLFGGSIAVMLIDGDDMGQPLGEVRQGAFRGLMVFDRWQVNPSFENVQELGPNFGKPKYYEIVDEVCDVKIPGNRIHYSRVIRFEGRKLPAFMRRAYMGWGGSILEPVMDRVKAFDLATSSAAQLISKAFLRYYKVKGLRELLANRLGYEGFMRQMEHVRQFQSNEGMTLGDTEDEFQVFSYSFTGLPELLVQFGQQISGACGIPLVRLFGQSPAGMNATGESDFRNYYDNVRHEQELQLRSGVSRLLRVVYESTFGASPGYDIDFDFVSLWQLTSEQKAEAAKAEVESILSAVESGVINTSTALKELKTLSGQLGVFSSITDEDIAAAESQERLAAPDGVSNGETIQGASEGSGGLVVALGAAAGSGSGHREDLRTVYEGGGSHSGGSEDPKGTLRVRGEFD